MPANRPALVAVVVAVLFNAGLYLALTGGLERLQATDVLTEVETGHVPELLRDPPDTVPTTASYGPVGPVAAVFAGGEVRTGLFGRVQESWIAVSSQDGRYRALSAPDLPDPRPGAVSVSPDGRWLAWGADRGVVLYDAVRDESRVVAAELGAEPVVGDFSPDGRRLLVHDDALHVVDLEGGAVVATLSGIGPAQAEQAVWTTGGREVAYVADGALVRHTWADGSTTLVPTTVPPDAILAWSPAGRQVAVMRTDGPVRFVEVFDVARDRMSRIATVRHDGYAQRELLGFTGEGRVVVSALTLETGPIPLVFTMSTADAFPPSRLMQLPPDDQVVGTLALATDPLAAGSWAFDEPRWPLSRLAKLTASVVTTVFLLGLYLTRRPRELARPSARSGAPERVDA